MNLLKKLSHRLNLRNNLFTHDLILFMSLIFMGFYYLSNIEYTMDIALYDESAYLFNAFSFPSVVPKAESSPLYSVWYWVLSFFQPNKINLFYLNYRLLTILPGLLIYLIFRTNSKPVAISYFSSLVIIFHSANIITNPKVAHFAIVMIFLGVLLSSLGEMNPERKGLLFVVVSLLASYIRPEFFISFIILIVIFIGFLIFNYKNWFASSTKEILLTVFICFQLISFFGVPFNNNGRSMMAFGQHYSVNWVEENESALNPWTNWEIIIIENFGAASSVTEALINNPVEFGKHIKTNLKNSVPKFKRLILSNHKRYQTNINWKIFFGTFIAFFVASYFKKTENHKKLLGWSKVAQYLKPNNFFFVAITLPVTISIVVIYPRDHYLISAVSLIFLFIGLLVIRSVPASLIKINTRSTFVILAFSYIVIAPISFVFPIDQNNLQTIRYLQSLNITKPVNFLEAHGGFHIYTGDNYRRVPEYSKTTSFNLFHRSENINMILLSDRLRVESRYISDAEWGSFLQNPESMGYVVIEVPNTTNYVLYIREYLIDK